jgi:hypothetical protein
MSGIDIKKSLVYNTTIDVLVSIDSVRLLSQRVKL